MKATKEQIADQIQQINQLAERFRYLGNKKADEWIVGLESDPFCSGPTFTGGTPSLMGLYSAAYDRARDGIDRYSDIDAHYGFRAYENEVQKIADYLLETYQMAEELVTSLDDLAKREERYEDAVERTIADSDE